MKYTSAIWEIMKYVEEDDPNFEFLAGLLSFGLSHNGLSDKQAKYADKFINKYKFLFESERPARIAEVQDAKTIN